VDDGRPVSLDARLEVLDLPVVAGGAVKYAVLNLGAAPIMVGEAFVLERLVGDEWEHVEVLSMFRAWGRALGSGERFELMARVPERARPGRYRLRKSLMVDRDPSPGLEWAAGRELDPVDVSTEFDVVSG
jgi:hypothetical protein